MTNCLLERFWHHVSPTHNWSKTGKNEYFERVFGAVSTQFSRISAPIHNYNCWNMDPPLNAKEQEISEQWVEVGGSALKMVKMVSLAGKVICTVFWDTHGITFISTFKRKNNNRRMLCNVIGSIEQWNQAEVTACGKEKVFFYQNNAPAHKGAIAMAKLQNYATNCFDIHCICPVQLLWT